MNRFVSFLICATLAGLCYVYTEVEAVKIGYEIRRQEEVKVQILDRSRALKYNIAALKAPHNLERRLSAQNIKLEPPKSWQTLLVADGTAQKTAQSRPTLHQPPFWGRFFVGTAQAEAKET